MLSLGHGWDGEGEGVGVRARTRRGRRGRRGRRRRRSGRERGRRTGLRPVGARCRTRRGARRTAAAARGEQARARTLRRAWTNQIRTRRERVDIATPPAIQTGRRRRTFRPVPPGVEPTDEDRRGRQVCRPAAPAGPAPSGRDGQRADAGAPTPSAAVRPAGATLRVGRMPNRKRVTADRRTTS